MCVIWNVTTELVSVNHQEICRGHEHMYGDTHGLTGECSKRATRDSFHRRQCWTGASDWWTPVPHLSGNNRSISETTPHIWIHATARHAAS